MKNTLAFLTNTSYLNYYLLNPSKVFIIGKKLIPIILNNIKSKLLTMKIEDIKHPELKQLINMSYLHGENDNQKMVEKTDCEIKDYLSENTFIISTENNDLLTIPYGNDGKFVIPIFTDLLEYERGMEYFRLNEMDENKDYTIEKIEKIDDPNFLGYLINIASVSYITLL